MVDDRQYYRSSLSAPAAVPLTPLIDVVFLVVIFFMVNATLAVQSTLPVQLPRAAADAPADATAFAVTVDQSGQIFIADEGGATPVTLDQLRAALGERQADRTKAEVVLHGDAGARYGRLVAVMDVIRSAGVVDIGLVAVRAAASP